MLNIFKNPYPDPKTLPAIDMNFIENLSTEKEYTQFKIGINYGYTKILLGKYKSISFLLLELNYNNTTEGDENERTQRYAIELEFENKTIRYNIIPSDVGYSILDATVHEKYTSQGSNSNIDKYLPQGLIQVIIPKKINEYNLDNNKSENYVYNAADGFKPLDYTVDTKDKIMETPPQPAKGGKRRTKKASKRSTKKRVQKRVRRTRR